MEWRWETVSSSEIIPKVGATMSQYREEKDSMGPVRIPADMLYGAQTERARQNFPISRQLLTDFVGSRAPRSRRALRFARTAAGGISRTRL